MPGEWWVPLSGVDRGRDMPRPRSSRAPHPPHEPRLLPPQCELKFGALFLFRPSPFSHHGVPGPIASWCVRGKHIDAVVMRAFRDGEDGVGGGGGGTVSRCAS